MRRSFSSQTFVAALATIAASVVVVVGCGSSVEDPSLPGETAREATPAPIDDGNGNPETKAYSVIVKEKLDCSSLSKGGSCGSYNGVQYCKWCPEDGCDQSKCECLPNTAGTGCNGGPSSGPAR